MKGSTLQGEFKLNHPIDWVEVESVIQDTFVDSCISTNTAFTASRLAIKSGGYTILHMAMHPSTNAPPSTVLKLIQKSTPAFHQMRDGTKGMNSLHYALLHKVPEDIFTAVLDQGEPSLVLDQNDHGNNAVHYAIKNKVSKKNLDSPPIHLPLEHLHLPFLITIDN